MIDLQSGIVQTPTLCRRLRLRAGNGSRARWWLPNVFWTIECAGRWLVSGVAVGATLVWYDGSCLRPDHIVLWDRVGEIGVAKFGTRAPLIGAMETAGLKTRETSKPEHFRTILCAASGRMRENYDGVCCESKAQKMLACNASFPSMPVNFRNDSDRERYRSACFSRMPHVV